MVLKYISYNTRIYSYATDSASYLSRGRPARPPHSAPSSVARFQGVDVRRRVVKREAVEFHAIRGGRRSDSSVVLAGVTENHVRFQNFSEA